MKKERKWNNIFKGIGIVVVLMAIVGGAAAVTTITDTEIEIDGEDVLVNSSILNATNILMGTLSEAMLVNASDWNNASGWGNHSIMGYLTGVAWGIITDKPANLDEDFTDDLVDSDFGLPGIMTTDGVDGYSSIIDNSSEWDKPRISSCVPTSSAGPCDSGRVCYNESYLFVCVNGTNWGRVELNITWQI